MENNRIMVVAAHTADWLWRCSGTMAKYLAKGYEAHVVCLTYGARGESGVLWKTPGQTADMVKKQRYQETIAAAESLGLTSIEIWDFQDCMLEINTQILDRLNLKIREVNPCFILTHDPSDNTNPDHGFAGEIVFRASCMAKQSGVESGGAAPVKMLPIYGFEPSMTENSGYVPQIYIDITDTYEKKVAAMECILAQKKTPEIHKRTNIHRGWQAARLPGGKGIQYAESFSIRYPIVADEFPSR